MEENKYIIDFREVKYYLEMHGVIWKALTIGNTIYPRVAFGFSIIATNVLHLEHIIFLPL